ncbi:MAG: cytochrome c [Acidobacteriota bacterium]
MFFAVGLGAVLTAAAADDPPAPTLVDAPGREVVQRVCSECHDAAKRITKFRKSEAEWADVITDMQNRGLMADDKDIETVLAYLTRNYGTKEGGQ